MSKLSSNTGALLVAAGLLFGCKKDQPPAPPASTAGGTNTSPLAGLKVPTSPGVQLSDLHEPSTQPTSTRAVLPLPPPPRSTNSTAYAVTKHHLDAFERWLTSAPEGKGVASRATRHSPGNDEAIKDLQHILNDYNSLVPVLHPGQKSWRPLNPTGNFDGATEAMVKRIERLLNLVSSGRAGREFFFAARDALEEAYGATPRLHKVLRASILAENKSLSQSPNIDPFARYPAIKAFCYESHRRLIETPKVSPHYQKDIQLVKEVQHCLIKLGYDFDIKTLQQTGVRDNATDEALKLFCSHFLQHKGPLVVDQQLIYKLGSVATGFDFVLGATLNSEYDGVPYSKDPYKSYCGLTQATMQSWCKQKGITPPNLFDIRESLLRTCFREVFVLPVGVEHILTMSAGPERVKALELARLIADESYNRGSERALKTVAYALAATGARPDKQTMTQLLRKPDAVALLLYGRAFWVGFNGGRFEEGLSNRLEKNQNYIVSLPPATTLGYVERGLKAGREHREHLERTRHAQEEHAASKKAPKPDNSKEKRVASNKKSKAR